MSINIWNFTESRTAHSWRWITVGLAIAYPLFAHGASLLHSPGLSVVSVVILAAAILVRPLAARRRWAVFAVPGAAAVIVGLWMLDATALVMFLPPVFLFVFLAWLFGHTLRRGSQPLIEQLVRLLEPPGGTPKPAVIRYAVMLTRVWAGLFGGLAIINLGLAAIVKPGGLLEAAGLHVPIFVTREAWSLFANVLNYIIVSSFFVLEYGYRRHRFPDRPYRNFVDFLRRALAAAPALTATIGTGRAAWVTGRGPDTRRNRDSIETEIHVPPAHPVFAGHFPDRPLLPGVMLIERVIEAAEELLGRPLAIVEMPRVKFLAPLGPGDRAHIRLRREREMIHFEVRLGEIHCAQGTFRIGADRTSG